MDAENRLNVELTNYIDEDSYSPILTFNTKLLNSSTDTIDTDDVRNTNYNADTEDSFLGINMFGKEPSIKFQYTVTYTEKDIMCPITCEIFHDPVVAKDGFTYERIAIKSWFENHNRSPMTNKKLKNKAVYPNLFIKEAIERMRNTHPHIEEHIFSPDYSKKLIDQIIKTKDWSKLIRFNTFNTEKMIKHKQFYKILRKCNDIKILKHIVDNSDNMDYVNSKGTKPIIFYIRYSNADIISYLHEKGVNFEYENHNGNTAINHVCMSNGLDALNLLLEKGLDPVHKNKHGMMALHHLCNRKVKDDEDIIISMIDRVLDNSVDIDAVDNKGNTSLHYACMKSTPLIINHIINCGADLEAPNHKRRTPFYYICQNGSADEITNFVDLGVNTHMDGGLFKSMCKKKTPKYYLNKNKNINKEDKQQLLKYIKS